MYGAIASNTGKNLLIDAHLHALLVACGWYCEKASRGGMGDGNDQQF
ncbi:hypothetical protein FM102_14120 [Corynebacterium glutamicum]|nr:hypothetical protein FM102_14120 [Corynebacterium glutamicum]